MRETSTNNRRKTGSVLVFVTLGMLALLGLTAFALETGQVWNAKGQLQGATDASALAGAGSLLIPGQPPTRRRGRRARATARTA
jgi:hypothetical protein